MPERSFTDAEVDAAVAALTEPERFREAEAHVARVAPQLQRILNAALDEGGFFETTRSAHLRQALASQDPQELERGVRTLMAEETRIGMLIGVAVGWALGVELESKRDA